MIMQAQTISPRVRIRQKNESRRKSSLRTEFQAPIRNEEELDQRHRFLRRHLTILWDSSLFRFKFMITWLLSLSSPNCNSMYHPQYHNPTFYGKYHLPSADITTPSITFNGANRSIGIHYIIIVTLELIGTRSHGPRKVHFFIPSSYLFVQNGRLLLGKSP